jgi:hypothetical protein
VSRFTSPLPTGSTAAHLVRNARRVMISRLFWKSVRSSFLNSEGLTSTISCTSRSVNSLQRLPCLAVLAVRLSTVLSSCLAL